MFNLMKVNNPDTSTFPPFLLRPIEPFLTHQFQVLPHHSQDSRPGKTEND